MLTDVRFTTISAEGLTVSANSTCGLTASGEAWCWGDNHFGKLGTRSTESSPVPVQVQSSVAFDSIWTGYWHVCARATAGELWCWGEQETDPGAFGGQFYGPSKLGGINGPPRAVPWVRRALDEDEQARLWDRSEQLTGVAYDL